MKNSAKQYGHNHGEAFMLMTYACDHCGHLETIWNSRDGVTPFCIECPSCGQMKCQHVDWQRDTYAPDHKPHRGQRFWRDGTPDEAEAIMRRRIASLSDEHPVDKDREAELIKYAREGEGEFRKGWPMLDRAPEAIAAALVGDSRDTLIEDGHEEHTYKRFQELFNRGRAAGGFEGDTQNLIRELTNAMRDAANWRAETKIALQLERQMRQQAEAALAAKEQQQ